MLLELITLAIGTLVLWIWLECDPFYWKRKGIPSSLPWPLVGNTFGAITTPLQQFWYGKYMALKNHRYYGLHLFGHPTLLINDPDLAKKMLVTDGDYFLSHGFHSNQDCDILGRGLFFVDGEQWRKTRQKMSPYFTPSRIKSMVSMVEPLSEQYSNLMMEEGKKGPVDVLSVCHKYATDLIVASTFGIKPDCMANPKSFFNDLNRAFNFNFIIKILFSSVLPRIYDYFRIILIPVYYDRKIKEFLREAIRIRLRKEGDEISPDFLQGMVELVKKEDLEDNSSRYNSDGTRVARFDEEGAMAQCMVLYAAGSDTTAATLASLLYELALNPHVQDKVRSEITAMMKGVTDLKHHDLTALTYTNYVLDETLRKYSIVPVIPRKCIRPYNLDGVQIDTGTLVYFNSSGMQRDPAYFPKPDTFLPERFESMENINTGSYLPFGMGVRTCIGLKFARVSILMAVCKLISKYQVLPSSRTIVPMQLALSTTMAPKNLWLLVQPIN